MKMLLFKCIGILSIFIPISQSCGTAGFRPLPSPSLADGAIFFTSYQMKKNPSETIPSASLTFKPGDIISCAIEPQKIASHMMLAVSDHHVIHIPG